MLFYYWIIVTPDINFNPSGFSSCTSAFLVIRWIFGFKNLKTLKDCPRKSASMKITSFPGQASPHLMGSSRRSVCRDKDQIQSNLQKFQLVEFQNESFEDGFCVSCGFWNVCVTTDYPLVRDKILFAWCNLAYMSTSNWWLKLPNLKKSTLLLWCLWPMVGCHVALFRFCVSSSI